MTEYGETTTTQDDPPREGPIRRLLNRASEDRSERSESEVDSDRPVSLTDSAPGEEPTVFAGSATSDEPAPYDSSSYESSTYRSNTDAGNEDATRIVHNPFADHGATIAASAESETAVVGTPDEPETAVVRSPFADEHAEDFPAASDEVAPASEETAAPVDEAVPAYEETAEEPEPFATPSAEAAPVDEAVPVDEGAPSYEEPAPFATPSAVAAPLADDAPDPVETAEDEPEPFATPEAASAPLAVVPATDTAATAATPATPATPAATDGTGKLVGDTSDLSERWQALLVGFVDEPRTAVEGADTLVGEVLQRVTDALNAQRGELDKQWRGASDSSTEDLRLALRRYRDLFQRLIDL